jgi:hypothetical protein
MVGLQYVRYVLYVPDIVPPSYGWPSVC